MKSRFLITIIFFVLFSSKIALASLSITEVMYDAPSTDGGHEWLEVCNDGSTAVDGPSFYLRENETNHSIKPYTTSTSIDSNMCAVIADNPALFSGDFPSYPGMIFDSTFSLSNSGEEISLMDKDKNQIDTIVYDVSLGAKGDGNTLNRDGNIQFVNLPTPGIYKNYNESSFGTDGADQNSDGNNGSSPSGPVIDYKEYTPEVRAKIIPPSVTVIAGAETSFDSLSYNKDGDEISNARFLWNFGDGVISEGKSIVHTYLSPGDYVVYVDVAYNDNSSGDRAVVKVRPADIVVSQSVAGIDGFIEVKNNSQFEIDLSSWGIAGGSTIFSIPNNTRILPKTSVAFHNEVTGIKDVSNARLLYPNGKVVLEHKQPVALENKQVVIPKTSTLVSKNNSMVNYSLKSTTDTNVLKQDSAKKDTELSKDVPVLPNLENNLGLAVGSESANRNYWPFVLLILIIAGAVLGLYFIPKKASISDDYEII